MRLNPLVSINGSAGGCHFGELYKTELKGESESFMQVNSCTRATASGCSLPDGTKVSEGYTLCVCTELTKLFQTHLEETQHHDLLPGHTLKRFQAYCSKSRLPKRQEQSEDYIMLPCPVCLQRFYLYKTEDSSQETDAI